MGGEREAEVEGDSVLTKVQVVGRDQCSQQQPTRQIHAAMEEAARSREREK